MLTMFKRVRDQVELSLAGSLPAAVRSNMYIELYVSFAYGAFYAAAVNFLPVVLRRMDASAGMIAFYTSSQFLGSVLAALSIVLMRRRRTMSVMVVSWTFARALFLFYAFLTDPFWMILLGGVFWLFEVFPTPGYTRMLQKMYPDGIRGRVMSLVRMGRVLAVMLVTPLAGWALDHWGYRVLFPLGSLLGILSALLFVKLDAQEGPLPPRQTKAVADLWQILRDDRKFAFYVLSFTIFGMGTLMAWTIYPLVQVDRLHLSYSELGLLGLVQSIFWLLGFWLWGKLVDQRGGLYVVRITAALALIIPTSYIWATAGWMLLPAFAAQGLVNAGFDMGPINAGIQLADPERITEYAAVQTTVVGIRGLIMPMISVGILGLGMPDTVVFALSLLCMAVSWVMLGYVEVPVPGDPAFAERAYLRYRWPLRARNPRM